MQGIEREEPQVIISDKELVLSAIKAKEKAYAPYSGFRVGACLLTKSGRIYTGCNVENASYSLTICAERVAVFKAVSDGERDFKSIAIAFDSEKFIYPCGACRQVLAEFSPNIKIILVNEGGNTMETTLQKIFKEGTPLKDQVHRNGEK